jgi:hypothetical protein
MDRPVEFIRLEGGRWQVTEDARRLLSSIEGKVAVLTVAGLFRYVINIHIRSKKRGGS